MIGVLWAEFGILYGAALIGGIAIVPYSMRLVTLARRSSIPLSKLLLGSFVQNAVLFAVVVAIGLRAAHAVGLRAPYIEAAIEGQVPSDDASPILLGLVWFRPDRRAFLDAYGRDPFSPPSCIVPRPRAASHHLGELHRLFLWRCKRGAADAALWHVGSCLAIVAHLACPIGHSPP